MIVSQNSQKSFKKGISEQVLPSDLIRSSSALKEKIALLLSDPKYKTNVVAASKAFRDQKETPLDRALWWIEWAIRNPNGIYIESVSNVSNHLSFLEIHSVDVISFIAFVSAVFCYGVLIILKTLVKLILCRKGDCKSKRKLE